MLALFNHLSRIATISHEHCYLWKPEWVGLHIASNALIALAYYGLAISSFYLIRKRRDLSFANILLIIAIFTLACGTTHLLDISFLWYSAGWELEVINAVMALTTLSTAALLLSRLPNALALTNSEQLQATNQVLEQEIRKYQQIELKLRESEEKYRLLFFNELDAVSLFDVETGQLLDVNQAFEALYGYSRVEALQLKVADVSAEPAQSQMAIRLADSTGNARIHLRWHRKKDGTVFPVELCVGRFIWNHRPVMCAVARDITERHRAETALRESEERFRLLLQDLHVGVVVYGANGTILLSNAQARQLLGLSEDQLLGNASLHPMWTAIYENGLPFPAHLHPVPQAIAQRQPIRNVVMGVYRPQTDDRVWLLMNAEPQLDESGNVKQVICTFSDMTDRKLADEALSLADFSFDRSAVAAVWISSNARILRVNQGACEMLGYSQQELQSMYVYQLDPNVSHEVWAEHWTTLRQQKTMVFESQLQTKAGHFIPIETTLNYLEFNGEEYNFAFAKDISDRLRVEAALRQQAERERLLVSVTEHIRQSLELEKILNTAVAEVRQLLQSDRVIIYRFASAWSGTIVAESVCAAELSILNQSIYDPCFASGWHETYRQGRIHTLEDVHTSNIKRCYQQLLTSLQVRANLVVPILHDTTLWGLLIVHHCFAPHSWQSWEIESLRQLTSQLAIAIQQSELYRQVQQFNTHLEQQVRERTEMLQRSLNFEALLKRITDKVRDSLEESYILQTAVQELAIGLNVYCCDAALYNLEQGTSTICYEWVRGGVPVAQGKVIPLSSRPDIYDRLLEGNVLQLSWISEHPPFIRSAVRLATLACPLIDDQGVIGDLWLFQPAERCFEELEIRLVQQVANQCAIALRQARLYQAAQTQVQELERLNHLKDDFLSTVSHELRTPMSNITMATQMLEVILKPTGLLDPESGEANRYFHILQDECEREIALINDLLDLSRLESGVEPLAIAPVDLKLWLPYILEPFEERTRMLQQRLQLTLPEQLPFLETDLSYLESILAELLTNACKYTPAEQTILISARATSDQLQLSVGNSGVKIPADELPHLFEKFYRVPSCDPWKHGGTGLGLALVQRRVQQIQGTISVTSEHNWTTFTLVLPIALRGIA